ncbi:MAG: RluA family pseudouridine synthase [Oscillospiraceae bacterium]|nr:RluA family pseudouridine synthase [Oscillospiraceae bacterium]
MAVLKALRFTVEEACEGCLIKEFLRRQSVSVSLVKQAKNCPNGIKLNGQKAITIDKVHTGDRVEIILPPDDDGNVIAAQIPLQIVYESDYAMVLEKPANMPVHPSRLHLTDTLANGFCALMQQRGEQALFRAVNRLDRNTSGLVLCAMNAYAAPILAKSVQKKYTAIVEGDMPLGEGTIEAPIARQEESIITRCVDAKGQYACTKYRVLACGGGYSKVECTPVTGRTHQIRVHMASLGHPLAGDDLYGGHLTHIKRHALHCTALQFIHPVTKQLLQFESTFPADMEIFDKLMYVV